MFNLGRLVLFLCAVSFASVAAAAGPSYDPAQDRGRQGGNSDRTGYEATVAYRPAPGAYNNYCQTWRAYREQDRKLFNACLADD